MSSTIATIAPLWRRLAALVYDSLVMLAISMAYGALITLIAAQTQSVNQSQYQPMFHPGGTSELVLIGWVVCLVAFYVIFWRRSGQTIGMRAWRLKLVDSDNTAMKPSIVRCLQRCAWAFLGFSFFGVGYWYQLLNSQKQCLHDRLTRTQVVVLPK